MLHHFTDEQHTAKFNIHFLIKDTFITTLHQYKFSIVLLQICPDVIVSECKGACMPHLSTSSTLSGVCMGCKGPTWTKAWYILALVAASVCMTHSYSLEFMHLKQPDESQGDPAPQWRQANICEISAVTVTAYECKYFQRNCHCEMKHWPHIASQRASVSWRQVSSQGLHLREVSSEVLSCQGDGVSVQRAGIVGATVQ